MGKRCKRCGENAVSEDDGQEVCTSCGTVDAASVIVSGLNFDSVFVPENDSGHVFSWSGLTHKYLARNLARKPAYLMLGKRKIEALCGIMSLSSSVKDYAIQLYSDLGERKKTFKHMTNEKKEVFSCACLYIACREVELPITMEYMSSLIGAPPDAPFSAVNQIALSLNIRLKPMTVSNLVDAVITQDLQPDIIATIATKKLTQGILELIADLYLTQGRKPQALIAAAFFLAYQNEDFIARRKLKPTKVIKKRLAVTQRLNLIRPSLLEMLKGIPWLSERDSDVSMIPYYIKDIIRYKKTLMREALDRTSAANLHSDSDETGCEYSSTNDALHSPKKRKSDNFQSETHECKTESRFVNEACNVDAENQRVLPKIEDTEREPSCRQSRPIKREAEPNTLFHPPAYKSARRRSREREEISRFIEEGRATLERLSKGINMESDVLTSDSE